MSDDDATPTLRNTGVPLLAPEVEAGWIAWNEGPEGRISWMYLDTVGLVTTGIGCMLADDAAAAALPWRHDDGSLADDAAKRAEWWAVKAMPFGQHYTARSFRAPGCLHMDDATIESLALSRLRGIAATLAAHWPAFPSYPWQAQAGLCLIAYAVGAGATEHGLTGPEWPHLQAAVARRDWAACAVEGQLRGNARRDAVVAGLFREAAG